MGVGPEVGERVDRQDAAILVGRGRQARAEVADGFRAGGAAISGGRCRGGGDGGGRGAGEFEGVAGSLISLAWIAVGGLGRRRGSGPLWHAPNLWLGRRFVTFLLIAERNLRRFLVGRRLLRFSAPDRRQQADDTHDHDRSLEPHLDSLQGVLREKPTAARDAIPLSKAIAWPARGTDGGGQNLRARFRLEAARPSGSRHPAPTVASAGRSPALECPGGHIGCSFPACRARKRCRPSSQRIVYSGRLFLPSEFSDRGDCSFAGDRPVLGRVPHPSIPPRAGHQEAGHASLCPHHRRVGSCFPGPVFRRPASPRPPLGRFPRPGRSCRRAWSDGGRGAADRFGPVGGMGHGGHGRHGRRLRLDGRPSRCLRTLRCDPLRGLCQPPELRGGEELGGCQDEGD